MNKTKYSEKARKVIILAEDEANRRGHSYIGTEHLLIALLREDNGVAAGILKAHGVNLKEARLMAEYIIGNGEKVAMDIKKIGSCYLCRNHQWLHELIPVEDYPAETSVFICKDCEKMLDEGGKK